VSHHCKALGVVVERALDEGVVPMKAGRQGGIRAALPDGATTSPDPLDHCFGYR